jgi:hypothetical protein
MYEWITSTHADHRDTGCDERVMGALVVAKLFVERMWVQQNHERSHPAPVEMMYSLRPVERG